MVPVIPEGILPAVQRYLALLDRWNRTHALTALPMESRLEELIQDACALLPHLPEGPGRAVDFGTGMGIPAVVIALSRPNLDVVALDKSGKKVAFVRQVALELELRNLLPLHARAEQVDPQGAQVGMAKAVGSLEVLLGWWSRHGNPGAPFLALKGSEEASQLPPPGWRQEVFPYELPTRGRRQVLRLTRAPGP